MKKALYFSAFIVCTAGAEHFDEKSGDIIELSDSLREITGRVEELENSVTDMKNKISSLENSTAKAKEEPVSEKEIKAVVCKTPEEITALVVNMIDEGNTEKARGILLAFVKQNPKHIYCGRMLFYAGNCYFLEKDYENAAMEYMKGFKANPHGGKAAETLYKLALCFEKLQKKDNYKLTLERIRDDYPGEFAKKAAEKLKNIK
ncbi:MAG: tetratricopeptide repeat protein [Holosporaceae bacterium]|jgi:TolA-binding protein|nr:tetratricopeptide repeat protein [Holosporaceae bacterium]